MIGRFERRLALVVLACALLPLAVAALLVDRVVAASEAVASGERQRRREVIEQARQAYAELFQAKKAALRERAQALGARAPTETTALATFFAQALKADPELARVEITPAAGSPITRLAAAPLAEDRFRLLPVHLEIGGQAVEVVFATPRAPFVAFARLDAMAAEEVGLELLGSRLGTVLRAVFAGGVSLVLLLALGLGLLVARRVTRRVVALSQAVARVGGGDLAVRVEVLGRDEISDLARAFNAMVGELAESRARIAYLQRLSAWQEVARRLAHEIRNPLTPIQLAVQQLGGSYQPRGDDDPYVRLLAEAREIVGEEIDGLRRLVDEFSGFARLPEAALAEVEARSLVEELLRAHGHFGGRVELVAAPQAVPLRADKLLLRRALQNLIENALQAGARRVFLTVEAVGGRAVIAVADDGPGVPKELGEKAFEPYVSAREHGTGLGLAIVKKITLEHGGEVVLDERPGGGARFTLRLPLA